MAVSNPVAMIEFFGLVRPKSDPKAEQAPDFDSPIRRLAGPIAAVLSRGVGGFQLPVALRRGATFGHPITAFQARCASG